VPARKNSLLEECFEANRRWAKSSLAKDPEFFARLEAVQNPDLLWIGCSDSRVPANTIIGRTSGEVFVHRNVANLVEHTDVNCLSVLQFAVDVLKVRHVIVCGHYGCGGVRAAMDRQTHGLIDNWLRHVQDVRERHERQLDELKADEAQIDRLCELNVVDQVRNVCSTTIVQEAWTRGQAVAIHGWIYDIHDGLLRDLRCTSTSLGEVAAAYARGVAEHR